MIEPRILIRVLLADKVSQIQRKDNVHAINDIFNARASG